MSDSLKLNDDELLQQIKDLCIDINKKRLNLKYKEKLDALVIKEQDIINHAHQKNIEITTQVNELHEIYKEINRLRDSIKACLVEIRNFLLSNIGYDISSGCSANIDELLRKQPQNLSSVLKQFTTLKLTFNQHINDYDKTHARASLKLNEMWEYINQQALKKYHEQTLTLIPQFKQFTEDQKKLTEQSSEFTDPETTQPPPIRESTRGTLFPDDLPKGIRNGIK